jgi:hypothetical protein
LQAEPTRFIQDEGEFTEGHELDRKWRVPKAMTRRLTQTEAKRLLAKFDH